MSHKKTSDPLGIGMFIQTFIDDDSHAATSPYFMVKTDAPIVAGYCIYRDEEFLRSSLDSVCMYVDAIVLLDGRFLDFAPLPLDDSERIISETASRFDPRFFRNDAMTQKMIYVDIEAFYGPMLEVEKRDLMLQSVRPGGFLFIIDGDEIAVGDVRAGLDIIRSNPEKSVFWVWVEEEGNPGWKPRIIRIDKGLHYGENHWTILNLKNEIVTDSVFRPDPNQAQIEEFKIFNFGSRRTGIRGQERVAYREIIRRKEWKEQKVGSGMT